MGRRRQFLTLVAIGFSGATMAFATAAVREPAQINQTPGPLSASEKPQRIMSMNMCDDLLLLQLVPKSRIVSITYLAHDAVEALMPGRDADIAINHGQAEEILQQKPDLILSSPWTTPVARRLAKQVGARVIEVEAANDFDEIRRTVRQVGEAVGEAEQAEALIRSMAAALHDLKRRHVDQPLRVVAWTGDGSVPGKGTLTDAIIAEAGGVNIGAKRGDDGYSSFGMEELLSSRPDAIMQGVGGYDQPSLRENRARHPLLLRLFTGRMIDYPDASYTCGLPQTAEAAHDLAESFSQVARGRSRW